MLFSSEIKPTIHHSSFFLPSIISDFAFRIILLLHPHMIAKQIDQLPQTETKTSSPVDKRLSSIRFRFLSTRNSTIQYCNVSGKSDRQTDEVPRLQALL